MLRRHFSFAFWGFIFVIVNINIGPFDILPNFLGYIFIASGLSGLAQVNSLFNRGVLPSMLLVLVSFFSIFYPINLAKGNINPFNLWVLGYGTIFLILNLFIIYPICKGIYLEAEKVSKEELIRSAKFRWNLMLVLTLVSLFTTPFTLNFGNAFKMYSGAISIILAITTFSIILLVRKAGIELCEG